MVNESTMKVIILFMLSLSFSFTTLGQVQMEKPVRKEPKVDNPQKPKTPQVSKPAPQDKPVSTDIPLVYVSGGTFTMGCTAEQGSDCYDNEKPAHRVTIDDYYIGKYEVTQAQWKEVMGDNPSSFKGNNLPVEEVSWDDIVGKSGDYMTIRNIQYYADGFIYKLNKLTGKQYRLPTEAEWEYAARGGTGSRGYKYSGDNVLGNVAWYKDNSGDKTHPVGTKSSNELGIYDMSGNVDEWCSDWKGEYSSSSQTNATRGGSWLTIVRFSRVSYSYFLTPSIIGYTLGFRLACSSK
jgi:formylglycine-generating enzyme required for sulfatase activity